MDFELALEALLSKRDEAESMVKMYRDEVLPKASVEVSSAQAQLERYQSLIVQIDAAVALMKAK